MINEQFCAWWLLNPVALRILGPTNFTAALGLHTQVRVCFEGTPVENKTNPQKG